MSDNEGSVRSSTDDDDHMDDGEDVNDFGITGIDNDWISRTKTTTTPLLCIRPIYFRQAKKSGKVIMSVNERYIREDLGFGCHFVDDTITSTNDTVTSSTSLSANRRKHVDRILGTPKTINTTQQLISLLQPCTPYSIVVCDTNVLLHNLDVLEQSGSVMPNIIIPQTSLHECRANRVVAYDRTVEVIRSVGIFHDSSTTTGSSAKQIAKQPKQRCSIFFPDTYHVATAHVDNNARNVDGVNVTINDENDARIRNVAEFFGTNLQGTGIRVILLTDDSDCRRIANSSTCNNNNYKAYSVREWVQELEYHNKDLSLLDVVSMHDSAVTSYKKKNQDSEDDDIDTMHFDPHVDATTLAKGMQSGLYYRGTFRSISTDKSMVTIRQGDERVVVTVNGKLDRNRGIDGDVVAVALHPLEKWISTSSASKKASHEETTNKLKPIVGIAPDTAEPTVSDITNVPESMVLDGDKSWKPTGKVVGIIRRNLPTLSGSIYEVTMKSSNKNVRTEKTEWEIITETHEREHTDGTTTCVFFAVDKRMPPILVRTSQRHRLLGQRIMVTIDSWPVTSSYPLGHYVRTIGPAGTKDVETQVLLHEHNIPYEPFSAAVLACLPPEDYKIDVDNSPGRTDLRNLPVLSIDPPGCKDIDDALHCIQLPNGNYQVGVHIADVTHYVKAGTLIDLEAANRSTSTYLVNKRLDMLPSLLTTDLCSLKGNVDRYAFSVLWEVTPDAHIINVDFTKSIIHSIAALTYQQAQIMIDQQDDPKDIQACAVKRLATLARKFRQRRIDAGALTLASPEVKFVLDSESLNPTDVQAYALLEANAVVEEFMLLANVTVAKKMLRHYPTLAVLRRHPAPNRSMFDSLISKASSRNLTIRIDDSKTLADSLDAAQVTNDPYVNTLLRILSTRCMSPAQYFCSGDYTAREWHHYGLAAPVYTHFTSPIRRYADVCVHRLVAAAIGVAPLPQHLTSRSHVHDLCENMNRRHRSAQLAGRASVQLHTLTYFSGGGSKEEDAYILDVETSEAKDPSLSVIVPRYGIEGSVQMPLLPADSHRWKRYPDIHKVSYQVDETNVISLQVFDKVKVKIWVRESQDHHRELVLDLLEPKFSATKTEPKLNKHSRDESAEKTSTKKLKS